IHTYELVHTPGHSDNLVPHFCSTLHHWDDVSLILIWCQAKSSLISSRGIFPSWGRLTKEGERGESSFELSVDKILPSMYFFYDEFKFFTPGGTEVKRRLVTESGSLMKESDLLQILADYGQPPGQTFVKGPQSY
ncbi:hypothetical protein HAX54_012045, partial [Datura stramonium]|nr:hypothetical protein [Datura stramonium]